MSSGLAFTKMHGLGNDFMMIDATRQPFQLTRKQIQAAADRHCGVGFDQLLVIAPPPPDSQADFTYLIFNGDGSSAQQCGNGARCAARFIQRQGLSNKQEMQLITAGKITRVRLEKDDNATVEISEPYFDPALMPFTTTESSAPYSLQTQAGTVQFYIAGVGNPHALILVDQFDLAMVATIGAQLSVHPNFPEGVNVGFMQIQSPKHIQLKVYERGSGLTLACGSGACAAVAVGRQLKKLDAQVQVSQTGGDLQIDWPGPGRPLQMRGPAQFVYTGILETKLF
jgi:diaminopimelate epimerase